MERPLTYDVDSVVEEAGRRLFWILVRDSRQPAEAISDGAMPKREVWLFYREKWRLPAYTLPPMQQRILLALLGRLPCIRALELRQRAALHTTD